MRGGVRHFLFARVSVKREKKEDGLKREGVRVMRRYVNMAVVIRICSFWIFCTGSTVSRDQLSSAYHDEGMDLSRRGLHADSLPFLRAAVRLNPSAVEYLQDLGGVEMELGDFGERFNINYHSL